MKNAYSVTKRCFRNGEIDSEETVLFSTKSEADKLSESWATIDFEFNVSCNSYWRLDKCEYNKGIWEVYEEDWGKKGKWAYCYEVSEADVMVYDRAVDTEIYKRLYRL